MYGDLNDCYGAALHREIAEMNRIEQESIEAANREAEVYYAEQRMLYEKGVSDDNKCDDNQDVCISE